MNIHINNRDYVYKNLTASISNDYGDDKKFNVFRQNKEDITVPLLWGIDNFPSIRVPTFRATICDIPDFVGTPRDNQKECIAVCEEVFYYPYGGGIINLNTGFGKTTVSLYLMGRFKHKTLIVVHTVELMEQWKNRIQQFLPGVKVGIIKGSVCQTEYPICIGMLQTISMRSDYTKDTFSNFSCVFIDECHHIGAEIFNRALWKIRNKYVFGLSATVERKDGLEKIFYWHCGKILYSNVDNSRKQMTIVDVLHYRGNTKEEFLYNGTPKISTMITNISMDLQRNNLIVEKLKNLEDDRRVLVLSDRISQLQQLYKMLGDSLSGLFTGSVKKKDKDIAKSKKILLATYSIANEGFDHPVLNTLVFATPRSNITQSVGRIYRKHHQIKPLIIDIVDTFSVFPYQFRKREKIYKTDIDTEELDRCLF